MNIKDIIGKEIAVHCKTEKEAKEFIRLAYANDCNWFLTKSSNETNYGKHKTATCYRIDSGRQLLFGSNEYYKFNHYKIINFNEIDNNFIETYQIDIKRKDNKTIAILKDVDGKYIKHAKAVCSPDDEYDYEVGKKIALSRLFNIETVDSNKVENNKDEESKLKSFKPYLVFDYDISNRLGIIGELTTLTAYGNQKLYIGDVVETFNSEGISFGLAIICKKYDCSYYAMGLANEKFENGLSKNGWSIVKKGSYKDLKPNTVIGCVKAIFPEQSV